MKQFYTKIVGVTFDDRQKHIASVRLGDHLTAVKEPNNQYDPNAIAVYSKKHQIGYLSRQVANSLKNQDKIDILVSQITGKDKETLGVNVIVTIDIDEQEKNEELCQY